MLYRNSPPNQWKWNGVGGKLQPGETPRECVRREVLEETGILLDDVRFAGLVTWSDAPEGGKGGMYSYVAEVDESETWYVMRHSDEGLLEWMPVSEAMSDSELVSNIPHFLPPMLNGDEPNEYHCIYVDGELHSVEVLPCPDVIGV